MAGEVGGAHPQGPAGYRRLGGGQMLSEGDLPPRHDQPGRRPQPDPPRVAVVRVDAETISADPRSRRRRTIPADQLRLALNRLVDHAWAVSFIVTDIPADDADLVGLETWFRNRVSVEERFREAKLGAGLFHLPSEDHTVNTVWTWAALLAGALNVMLTGLTGRSPTCATPAGCTSTPSAATYSPPRHG